MHHVSCGPCMAQLLVFRYPCQEIPYCYVPSKEQLGAAGNTKRPTSCVMVKTHADIEKEYDECSKGMLSVPGSTVCIRSRNELVNNIYFDLPLQS